MSRFTKPTICRFCLCFWLAVAAWTLGRVAWIIVDSQESESARELAPMPGRHYNPALESCQEDGWERWHKDGKEYR